MVTAESTDVRQFLQDAAAHVAKGDHQDSAAECARCEATRILTALSHDTSFCRHDAPSMATVPVPADGSGVGDPKGRPHSIAGEVATGAERSGVLDCARTFSDIALVVSGTAQKADVMPGQGAASADFLKLRHFGRVLSPEEIADAVDDGSARRSWLLDLHTSADLNAGSTIADIEASVQKVQARV